MKRLAICCDGTWNTPDQKEGGIPVPTNVVRLYNAIAEADEKGVEQRKYYHPGVGTAPGLWNKVAGGGLGEGLDHNIKSGYRYLAGNYETGDEIYLFGFSRGAYTARSLAGMVACCGILDATDLDESEIWRRTETIFTEGYRNRRSFKNDGWRFHAPPDGAAKIPIRFLGVWDTVGALGIPDDLALLNLLDNPKEHSFHDTTLSDSVLTARHAVAMDEQRASFQPTLWTNVNHKDLMQLWFPGVHCDVGGGYGETGLSDAALKWMTDEARGVAATNPDPPRLVFKQALVDQLRPSHHGILHDSLNGLFALLPTMPRSVPLLQNGSATLHDSATKRHFDPPITQAPYRRTRVLGPKETFTVDVFAAKPWNDTPLFLEAGKTYKMTASGEWLDNGVPCGPGGTKDGRFYAREMVHLVGAALGKAEDLFKQLGGNESANFILTKRHEEFPWMCLVGAVANSDGAGQDGIIRAHESKMIGAKATWSPERSGYFYAYANDAWRFYENNRGLVRLTVSRLT